MYIKCLCNNHISYYKSGTSFGSSVSFQHHPPLTCRVAPLDLLCLRACHQVELYGTQITHMCVSFSDIFTNIMFLSIIHVLFLCKTSSCLYFKTKSPQMAIIPIDWAQLNKIYLETEAESSLGNVGFRNKNRTMSRNIFTNVPSSQTFRYY
jgi:hypothetical protein